MRKTRNKKSMTGGREAASIEIKKHIVPKERRTITIFMKMACPHSQNALRTLQELGNKYDFKIKIMDMNEHPEIYRQLKIATDRNTVPQIFFGDEFIGGNDDLMAIVRRTNN